MSLVSAADTEKLKTLLHELQANPLRGDVILSENREFIRRMVTTCRDAGMIMPPRFNAIIAKIGL